jgi:hypothetical protein
MPDSPTLLDVFSAPFNWCDRKCERCPVAPECPVHRRELQNRWVRTARGVNPDDLQVAIEDGVHEMSGLLAATVPARLTATRLGAGANPSMHSRPDLARRESLMR